MKVLSLEPSLVCSTSAGAGAGSGVSATGVAVAGVATAGDSDEAIVQRGCALPSAVLGSASFAPAAGCRDLGIRGLGCSVSVRGWGSCWLAKDCFAEEYVQNRIARPKTGVNFACLLQERSDAGFKTPRVVNLQASAWAATPPTPIRRKQVEPISRIVGAGHGDRPWQEAHSRRGRHLLLCASDPFANQCQRRRWPFCLFTQYH